MHLEDKLSQALSEAPIDLVRPSLDSVMFDDKEEMKKFLGFHKGNPVRKQWEQLVNDRMYGCLDDGRVDEVLKKHLVYNAQKEKNVQM